MPANLSHFAIHANDVPRAIRFYEGVFGWKFAPWGPPGFYLITTDPNSNSGIHGALHARQAPVSGDGMIGFECTISVDDIDATAALVSKHGGEVFMPRVTIPTVGDLIKFRDTEGNIVGAMQYAR